MNLKLPEWLPDIVPFSELGSDLNRYLDHLYTIFKKDFIDSRPVYKGKPIFFDNYEIGKYPRCFWHLITEEKNADFRRFEIENLSLLRCERICWIRPVIENHSDPAVSCWENNRGKKNNLVFFAEDYDYVVVLNNKKRFYLVTAYHVNYSNRKNQLIRERDYFLKMQKPPQCRTA